MLRNTIEIGIIIPCYNEEKRLKIHEFSNFLNSHSKVNLLFIDDGSIDNTLEIIKKFCSKIENANYLSLRKNSGKAEAIRNGVKYFASLSSINYIGYFDADLSTSLNNIKIFYNFLKTNSRYKLIAGSRIKKLGSIIKRNLIRHYLGRIFATIVSRILMLPVY